MVPPAAASSIAQRRGAAHRAHHASRSSRRRTRPAGQRQLAILVEQQRAAVGAGDRGPWLPSRALRLSAADIAEQLGLEQIGRQRPQFTICRVDCAGRCRSAGMARQQLLLACWSCRGDERRRFRRSAAATAGPKRQRTASEIPSATNWMSARPRRPCSRPAAFSARGCLARSVSRRCVSARRMHAAGHQQQPPSASRHQRARRPSPAQPSATKSLQGVEELLEAGACRAPRPG